MAGPYPTMRRHILALLCLGTLLVSCNPRNFGHQKFLHIYMQDLQERVEQYCREYQRPPTADEVRFASSPLTNDYWFISDYERGHDGPFVVLLIDRLTLEQRVIYRGESKKAAQ